MTTIGIAQWLAVCGDPEGNLAAALDHIDALAARGCELVVLPELWPSGYDPATLLADATASAEPLNGPRGEALAAAASRHGMWLFAGTVPERDGDALFNTAVVYGPDGALRASHRKRYLYTPLGEDDVFSPGSTATVVEVPGLGPVGISTCFDGDHPTYARELFDLGARVVVSPCAYETAAESWWDVLYPANALVNGQWWIMANQVGGDLLGRSRVIAPDGSTLAEAERVGAAPTQSIVVQVDVVAGVARADRESGALRSW
jgi:predicted amidohydrolase